jgi:hypothetical protein
MIWYLTIHTNVLCYMISPTWLICVLFFLCMFLIHSCLWPGLLQTTSSVRHGWSQLRPARLLAFAISGQPPPSWSSPSSPICPEHQIDVDLLASDCRLPPSGTFPFLPRCMCVLCAMCYVPDCMCVCVCWWLKGSIWGFYCCYSWLDCCLICVLLLYLLNLCVLVLDLLIASVDGLL